MSPRGAGVVLVVDDDPGVRLSMAANLEESGLTVSCAASGAEALERLARDQSVDVLLTDVRMPGMTGVELWAQVHARWPSLPGVLMSAFANERVIQSAMRDGIYTVLHKPFDPEAAVEVVRRAARRARVLVLEPRGGPLAVALGPSALAVADLEGGQAACEAGEADVAVADADAFGWPAVESLGARAGLTGVVVVTRTPRASPLPRLVQLVPDVAPMVLRRAVLDLRGSP